MLSLSLFPSLCNGILLCRSVGALSLLHLHLPLLSLAVSLLSPLSFSACSLALPHLWFIVASARAPSLSHTHTHTPHSSLLSPLSSLSFSKNVWWTTSHEDNWGTSLCRESKEGGKGASKLSPSNLPIVDGVARWPCFCSRLYHSARAPGLEFHVPCLAIQTPLSKGSDKAPCLSHRTTKFG